MADLQSHQKTAGGSSAAESKARWKETRSETLVLVLTGGQEVGQEDQHGPSVWNERTGSSREQGIQEAGGMSSQAVVLLDSAQGYHLYADQVSQPQTLQ